MTPERRERREFLLPFFLRLFGRLAGRGGTGRGGVHHLSSRGRRGWAGRDSGHRHWVAPGPPSITIFTVVVYDSVFIYRLTSLTQRHPSRIAHLGPPPRPAAPHLGQPVDTSLVKNNTEVTCRGMGDSAEAGAGGAEAALWA